MMKCKKQLLALFLALTALFSLLCTPCFANDTERLKSGILDFNLKEADAVNVQAWLDGALSSDPASGGEWYALTLARVGGYDLTAYGQALGTYVEENKISSASSRLKYALTLLFCGSGNPFIEETLEEAPGKQGVMSYIYGLHLANNIDKKSKRTGELKDQLLSLQLAGGGFAVIGQNADVDATAMAVQALAPHKEEQRVGDAIEKALSFLSGKQTSDGHFESYGQKNAESACQVLMALCALDIDCQKDERFIKEGQNLIDVLSSFALESGAFAHLIGGKANENATAQAYMALQSLNLRQKDRGWLLLLEEPSDPPLPPVPSEDPTDDPSSSSFPIEPSAPTSDDRSSGEASLSPSDSPLENESPSVGGKEEEEPSKGANENEGGKSQKSIPLKALLCALVLFLGAVGALVLVLTKKHHPRNFLILAIVLVLALTLTLLLDVRLPEDYYTDQSTNKGNAIGQVTFAIRCDALVGKNNAVPEDGILLESTTLAIEEGDTVYDLLLECAKKHRLLLENDGSDKMPYIVGINGLYAGDYGDLSGWIYTVNGSSPSVGCGEYTVEDGDVIVWHYTCDMIDFS